MPMPGAHARALKPQAEALNKFAQVVADPGFKAAVDELTDKPEVRERAAANPVEYLKSKGLRLPDGLTAEIEVSPRSYTIGVCAIFGSDVDLTICCVGYNTSRGFFATCNLFGSI